MENILTKTKITINGAKRTLISIRSEEKEIVKQQFHHIHVLDRSGSMCFQIDSLIENVKATIKATDDNDLFSVVWFSGAGEYRTIIKGAQKSENLYTLLDKLKSTIGATCFSDPIKEINLIVKELADYCPNISVTFFTDGYVVTPWSIEEEKRKIFDSLNEMKDQVVAFNAVGYGIAYDQKLLQDIVATTEYGTFVHSKDIKEYKDIFMNNYNVLNDMVAEPIEITSSDKIVFLTDNFTKMTDKKLSMTRTSGNGVRVFVVGQKEFTFELNGEVIDTKSITETMTKDDKLDFLYAYACNSFLKGLRQECFDVLTKNIKDKKLADQQSTAFTFDEVSVFLKHLSSALYNSKERYQDGKVKAGDVVRKNTHCVMDVMVKLSNASACYLPLHKEAGQYQRVSRQVIDAENKFVKNDEPVLASFEDFVFANDKMNMSIKFKINGVVNIDKKIALDANLSETFTTAIFRTYTIIKDGHLNISKLVVAMPKDTLQELISLKTNVTSITMTKDEETALNKLGYQNYELVVMDLSELPIINRSYLDKSIDMNKIFEVCHSMLHKQALQKWINHYVKSIVAQNADAKQTQAFKNYTPSQIEILEQHGIDKSGLYRGIKNTMKASKDADAYVSKSFEFVFKGCSSLPSINAFEKRVASGKPLLISQQFLADAKTELEAFVTVLGHDLNKPTLGLKSVLDKKIRTVRQELRLQRYWLSGVKIAKTLTCDWFEELTEVDTKGNYVFEKEGQILLTKTNIKTEYK